MGDARSTDEARAGSRMVRAFATDLHRLGAGTGRSTIVSPWSIVAALAMTRAGAAGPTATEMDAVLHAGAGLHPELAALDRHLTGLAGPTVAENRGEAEITLRTANSVWLQDGLPLVDRFVADLAEHHRAQPHSAPFATDPEAARERINAWVAENTGGRIPHLLAPGVVNAMTRLVLANAVHLLAPWAKRFGPRRPAPFHHLDGTAGEAQLMTTRRSMPHRVGDGWVSVSIPYAGHELAMTVVLPDVGRFDDVDASCDLDAWMADGPPVDVLLHLPAFELDVPTDLTGPLCDLGMVTAFDRARADFSAMTPEEVFVGAVIHQATIAVDEEGTEAAAATAVIMELRGAMPQPSEPVEITVDRPFLFVVHDTATNTPLFQGRVTTLP